MGLFLAATAFRTQDADSLCEAVARFFSQNGRPARRVEPGDLRELSDDDAVVHDPVGAWTVVTWPRYMQDGPAAEAVTAALATTASSVHVYDGDYWVHRLMENGRTVDRFVSMPDYFAEDPGSEETARLAAAWAGRPEALAAAFGAAESDVAPYLLQAPPLEEEYEDGEDDFDEGDDRWGRAFPDDAYDRSDVWVFVDFWRRMGIAYPMPPGGRPEAPGRVLRLPPGATLKLPQGTDEF
jgi:hypothetical protein